MAVALAQVFAVTVATHLRRTPLWHCSEAVRLLDAVFGPGSGKVVDMVNAFGIPDDVEQSIRVRDTVCVYCGGGMKEHSRVRGCPKDKATIEHLNFAGPFYWDEGLQAEDIVICCASCNSSRGVKPLPVWFESAYCVARGISGETVATPVKEYLERSIVPEQKDAGLVVDAQREGRAG